MLPLIYMTELLIMALAAGLNQNSNLGVSAQKLYSVKPISNESQTITTQSTNKVQTPLYTSRMSDNFSFFDWPRIFNKQFGGNKDLLVSKEGYVSLLTSLGLLKMSTKRKNIHGSVLKCFSVDDIYRWYLDSSREGFTKEQFQDVCPTLLLQMHFRICKKNVSKEVILKNFSKVWIYSACAVLLCGVVGLFIVWLIPIIPKAYYNCISQLLIAIAVGSLSADALLHLIPHALHCNDSGSQTHINDSGKGYGLLVRKALAALIGIHLFFLTERITILCQNLKSKSKLKHKESGCNDRNIDWSSSNDGITSLKNKSSSITEIDWSSKSQKNLCNGDRDIYTAASHVDIESCMDTHLNQVKDKDSCYSMSSVDVQETYLSRKNDNGTVVKNVFREKGMESNGCLTTNKNLYQNNSDNTFKSIYNIMHSTEGNWSVAECDVFLPMASSNSEAENFGVEIPTKDFIGSDAGLVRDSPNLVGASHYKPHGHHHGHNHDLSSVNAIAFSVITGDGLHNFFNGIAIGAAFVGNLGGGLSTTIAVICHELPRELGDFVVLLHAGMQFKTVIVYNLLSSLFCAFGMVIGVLLSAVPPVSCWIFMVTAGMFLYTALVDMMPELSTHRLKGHKCLHRPTVLLIWQNIGLLFGASIILFIALHEEIL